MDIQVIMWGFSEVPVCKWYLRVAFSTGHLVGKYLFLVLPVALPSLPSHLLLLVPSLFLTEKLAIMSLFMDLWSGVQSKHLT